MHDQAPQLTVCSTPSQRFLHSVTSVILINRSHIPLQLCTESALSVILCHYSSGLHHILRSMAKRENPGSEGEDLPRLKVRGLKRSSRRSVLALAPALLGTAALPKRAFSNIIAKSFRLHDHGTHTRLVIELTEGLGFNIFSLSQPYRIVIDLPELLWQLPSREKYVSTGVIRDLRYGMFQRGQSRVVLDLNEPANVDKAFVLAPTGSTPWRMVVDLKPVAEAAFLGKAGAANAITVAGPNRPSQQMAPNVRTVEASGEDSLPLPQSKPASSHSKRRPVVALDPGHGGVDPGAIGVSGVREKDIALAAAKELRKALERTGRYKVVMTRTRDVSLGLRQRIARSRRAAADIFVSLHADSIGRSDVRGLSVYTLSENASDREAASLAVKENKADLIIGMDLTNESDDVKNILIDLAQRESLNLAAQLATKLIAELRRQVKLLRNTHRFAGFAVLKAPDIPSVLLEMGYLSNREDERALRQPSYRNKLVVAIVQALDGYFGDRDVVRPT